MWISTQDKTKLINTALIQLITLSKSYGSRDAYGKKLETAITAQFTSSNAGVSLGLYHNDNEAKTIIEQITNAIADNSVSVFQMPN